MKTNYQVKTLLSLSIFFCLVLTSYAQIRFISVNPVNETITIKNFGSSTINISSYNLCIFPSYFQLSSLSVTSGSLNLAAGGEVTLVSSTNLVDSGGELGLYIDTSSFSNSNNIRDYIQWISTGGTRESVAVAASIWDAGTAIPNTVSPPYQYNGNGTTSNDGQSFWGSTLSTEDFSLNGFSVYPNPSHDYINLKLPNHITQAQVEIYDMLGKNVHTNNNIINSKIDISNWESGLYIIRASSSAQTISRRFVKQ